MLSVVFAIVFYNADDTECYAECLDFYCYAQVIMLNVIYAVPCSYCYAEWCLCCLILFYAECWLCPYCYAEWCLSVYTVLSILSVVYAVTCYYCYAERCLYCEVLIVMLNCVYTKCCYADSRGAV